MASEKNPSNPQAGELLPKIFSGLFGAFLGLALLKFPNPPIMAKFVEAPTSNYEWLLSAWPLDIAYWLLGIVAVVGLFTGNVRTGAPKWLLALPLVWLGWQFVSATHTVEAELTRQTLKHFAACAACFYLGAFCLSHARSIAVFWGMLLGALVLVLTVGIEQHFGGLEETRRYFYAYVYPQMKTPPPPEYLKKISSDRIFATLFYPNALAGALLLLLPAVTTFILHHVTRLTVGARRFLAGLVIAGGLACLYWSGSKGGWLLMLVLGVIVLVRLRFSPRLKLALAGGVLVAGLAGFALKHAGYFERKATSVSARFDYWQAAVRTAAANPVFGTGPGTFAIPYQKIKRPEAEMARLTHNDYLQQASDSGAVGFATYLAFIVAALVFGWPRSNSGQDAMRFAVWLGLLGWALQGLLEFGLYVPALAWCGFALFGWLLGTAAKQFDNSDRHA